ncbi:MerR family transcriptional regulator [Nocardiopsis sp. MG754419]|uniref:MerR family transcriptional regulator n=1 Tax=Nocardiopsis sp. MG754419 TaxID=2259865 RepID=UPI001BAB81EF|nr:MerR family transcriptional regulator [Nocardiopsis sp. MG754419]MBR8745007.1 MerR family transcriptional regulator [Nocardiopsis sp. MG754419]
MRIGQVAELAGVSVRALRYYEEQHLLTAERTPGGQRDYPASAVGRVRLIQQLYAAGLPSRTVREVLPCVDTGEATPDMLDRLMAERSLVDRRIADLIAARDQLDEVIGIATNASGHTCESTAPPRSTETVDAGRPHGR